MACRGVKGEGDAWAGDGLWPGPFGKLRTGSSRTGGWSTWFGWVPGVVWMRFDGWGAAWFRHSTGSGKALGGRRDVGEWGGGVCSLRGRGRFETGPYVREA